MSRVALLFGPRDGGNGSELLALHPGVDIPFCLLLRDPGARPDHRAELPLGLDRRAVEVGQEAPFPLRILDVALFTRDGVGALAASESEHGWSPESRRPEA